VYNKVKFKLEPNSWPKKWKRENPRTQSNTHGNAIQRKLLPLTLLSSCCVDGVLQILTVGLSLNKRI